MVLGALPAQGKKTQNSLNWKIVEQSLHSSFFPPRRCDPYTEKKSTCGGICSTGNSYSAQVRYANIERFNICIQLSLSVSGPGAIDRLGIQISADF
jgi:hypothetical protein